MQKKILALLIILGLFSLTPRLINAHCQLPCGIYGDNMRIVQIKEHITTIEKSMRLITELQKNPSENMNQIVRWVNNKDDHAQQLTEILTYYFMAQRIKVPESKSGDAYDQYTKQLTTLHQMQVAAMKTKQTTDHQYITQLQDLLDKFVNAYFSEEEIQHLKDEHDVGGM